MLDSLDIDLQKHSGLFSVRKNIEMKERLREVYNYLKFKKIISKQDDLATLMGYNRVSVSRALNGHEGYLTKEFLYKLTDVFPEINYNWLLTGEGSMLKESKIETNITPVPQDNYKMVEYVDLRASAGRLGVGDVELLPETHRRLVPIEFDNGNFLVVRVDGDSMDDNTKRALADGDEVLICERKDYKIEELPIRKSLFVITTRDGNVLKQIVEVNVPENYIVCRSFNKLYEDFKIEISDIFQIFIVCKVVQKQISLN